ncbi:hypothetical protein GLAREA_03611 [Glarea lozoyensis ATCC 20868]|uniref:Uncharacterized protein n=1 Tax=Glarea lozoyensis (strain ATCC 20868 / MF5171) TaxID=1116229 RepID=S3D0E8_GLAL2|nr:uncharacterized protein GLAREA_03611 [Glarea lozoyensis ATCC 20868]EPE30644.1 hypothetical protein GLAREA_03611 [Glarea lozoyensis ATCC 20868]
MANTSSNDPKLMDVEPGGEGPQYGGKQIVDPPKPTSSGQFGATSEKSESDQAASEEKKARGEKTAENIRYGEAISEHGFGGETTTNSGGVEDGSETQDAKQTRREQGYGPGSGVGA